MADLDFVLFYTPLPKVVQSHSAARGGNVLGLTGRKNDLISMRFSHSFLSSPLLLLPFSFEFPSRSDW